MDMKDIAEAQGRQEPSMIDALNVAFDRDLTQEDLKEHFMSKELSLSATHEHLNTYKSTMQHRIDVRMENLTRNALRAKES